MFPREGDKSSLFSVLKQKCQVKKEGPGRRSNILGRGPEVQERSGTRRNGHMHGRLLQRGGFSLHRSHASMSTLRAGTVLGFLQDGSFVLSHDCRRHCYHLR
jgi:hypothetical protein